MTVLLISREESETRVALLEEGRIAELYTERPGRVSRVGNIYRGRVENVLAGMDAAFVDIGLERNGYLPVDEVTQSDGGAADSKRRISELLRSGDEVLVQIARDEMGGKGARLTMHLSVAGRRLVFVPAGGGSGASRRLDEAERERLREVCRALCPGKDGLIARTAAQGATIEELQRELRFLLRIWGAIQRRAEGVRAPGLVHTELELALRAVRDLLGPGVERVIVDDEHLHRRVVNYLRAVAPALASCVEGYEGMQPLFEQHGVDDEARRSLRRRVGLPSGGFLVVDPTEAMTVIDVNTGRYVGRRFLEDTSLRTNLEACREIVRQLRLRDIGGIIVIDFIDMSAESNREAVLAALESELSRDRTKTYVVALSPLGLVEMTRQNVTPGLREVMTSVCPTCGGEGRVLSEEAALLEVERILRRVARDAGARGVRVEVHPRMADLLMRGVPSPLCRIEKHTGRRFLVQSATDDVPIDHVSLVPD